MQLTPGTLAVFAGAATLAMGALARLGQPSFPGDNCGKALPIGEGTYFGDTTTATNDGAASCGDSASSADVWFVFTAARDCLLHVNTCGSAYDTVLSIHTLCPSTASTELACNDDFDCDGDGDVGDDGYVSGVTVQAVQGQSYVIRVAGWQGATGPFTLNVSCQQSSQADDCSDAQVIGEGMYFGDTTSATNDGSASCGDSADSPDVWFRYMPTEDCLLRVNTCGSQYDTVLSIHDGCPGTAQNEIACNDDACNLQSSVIAAVQTGNVYSIRVAGWQGATGAFTLDLSCTPPSGGPGADVLIGELTSLQQFGRLGDIVGCALDSPVCNAGTEPLDWFGNPDPRHPFMVFNMYRLMDDRLQQIGQSWVKHGFASAQSDACGLGCIPWPDSTRTGIGCSDTYSASLNAVQTGLGPRHEIDPWTGAFTYSGSHMDVHTGGHDPIEHRLQLHDADLDPAVNLGAQYFCELYVLAHDDVDHMNSIAWESVAVSGTPGATWSFDIGAAGTQIGPALEAWPGATRTVIPEDPVDDGRAILAVKVADNGDGTWHYEYALYNHDLDRAIGSLSIPVGRRTTVRNVGFSAVRSHDELFSNEPWQQTMSGGRLTWATEPFKVNPNANPIRWGTLYNFWFDADAEPVQTLATLGLYAPGESVELTGATQGPAASFPADITGPLGVPDGCVDAFDLGAVLGAWCSSASDPDPPGDVDPPCEGCTSPNFALADISGPEGAPDGCVDAFDLGAVLAAWCSVAGGNPCGTCGP
ncbi:MAG: hypothetical protein IH830_11165 [Planctomycetes bacterium]|nr:hypothetical protein [Planctomycetota bacterium]